MNGKIKMKNLTGLAEFAAAQALPRDKKPQRLPVFPNLERTSIISLQHSFNLGVGVASTSTVTRACLMRSPCAPLWIDRSLDTWNARSQVFGDTGSDPRDYSDIGFDSVDDEVIVGEYDGSVYMHVPNTPDSNTPYPLEWRVDAVGGCEVALLVGTGDGAWLPATVNVDENWTSFWVVGGNWFRVSWLKQIGSTSPVQHMEWRLKTALRGQRFMVSCMGNQPLEIDNSDIPYRQSKATAVAALFTNVTKVLSKEGTVSAARIVFSPGLVPTYPWNFTASDLSRVHPSERYFGALENGLYSFTSPSTEVNEFRINTMRLIRITGGDTPIYGAVRPVGLFRLDAFSMFNAIVFSDVDTGNDSTLAVSLNYHLEFRCVSSLFPSDFAKAPLESYHQANLSLLGVGYFHDNPTHWQDIARRILSGIAKYAPMVHPVYGGIVGGVASLVRGVIPGNMNQAKMVQQGGSGKTRVKTKKRVKKVRVQRPKKKNSKRSVRSRSR